MEKPTRTLKIKGDTVPGVALLKPVGNTQAHNILEEAPASAARPHPPKFIVAATTLFLFTTPIIDNM